jgi:hypothetical protein
MSVGSTVSYTAQHFPANAALTISWKRPGGSIVSLGTTTTDGVGAASGSFTVPATEGGAGSAVIVTAGGVNVTTTVEIAARIAVIPGTVSRGQTVTVSLTGYGKHETVRIRWLVNGSWITVATVETSNTGSASISVTVPASATTGPNSVRGDGTAFRQQTNAVTVAP